MLKKKEEEIGPSSFSEYVFAFLGAAALLGGLYLLKEAFLGWYPIAASIFGILFILFTFIIWANVDRTVVVNDHGVFDEDEVYAAEEIKGYFRYVEQIERDKDYFLVLVFNDGKEKVFHESLVDLDKLEKVFRKRYKKLTLEKSIFISKRRKRANRIGSQIFLGIGFVGLMFMAIGLTWFFTDDPQANFDCGPLILGSVITVWGFGYAIRYS